MKRHASSAVFAERVVEGVDDLGVSERVVSWIERRAIDEFVKRLLAAVGSGK